MVKRLKKAVSRKGINSREALLHRLEGELDPIFDFIYQIFGDEEFTLEVLQATLRKAVRRSQRERYERYLRLWAFRIAIEVIEASYARFLSERLPHQSAPLAYLQLEEKLVLFLHDRVGLSSEDTAAVLQMQPGKVGRSLVYARERVARFGLNLAVSESLLLRERSAWNFGRELESAPETYMQALTAVRSYVADLPARKFNEIASTVRNQQLLPLFSRSLRWQDLSWQYKLGLEASLLGFAGLLAVVVLPWTFDRLNMTALVEGRFADVLQVQSQAQNTPELPAITTDRLLSLGENDSEPVAAEEDEFANVEFPSGDAYEVGSAPIAPSRQSAAVYRLIVQSPSPQELIPHVRTLFAQKNVRERESSGRVMPGGVYFDGVTNVGSYPQIVTEIRKLGQTKTYSSSPGARRNPNERARVIVWLQQI